MVGMLAVCSDFWFVPSRVRASKVDPMKALRAEWSEDVGNKGAPRLLEANVFNISTIAAHGTVKTTSVVVRATAVSIKRRTD